MLTFSELNHRCHQIFKQQIKIEKNELRMVMRKHQGQWHGISRDWYKNRKLMHERNYIHDRRHGISRGWHNNGKLWYETNYSQGHKHGISREYWINEQLRYEHNYVQGCKIKRLKLDFLFPNTMTALHKDILQLVFLELDHGHDMLTFSELNHRCHQIFKQQIKIEKNERIMVMKTHQGQWHGISRVWHQNGQLWVESNYMHDRRHGICRGWYKNGQLCYELNYLQGQKHGIRREWYPNGKLDYEANYYHGTQIEK